MGKISKEDKILIKNLRIEKLLFGTMEHMSNIFSTSFGIHFAKLTRVWLALISLTAKITLYNGCHLCKTVQSRRTLLDYKFESSRYFEMSVIGRFTGR